MYPLEIYRLCENELRIGGAYYRQTDALEIRYYTASRVINNKNTVIFQTRTKAH